MRDSLWNIRSGAVGAIEIGKPLPAELVGQELERRYRARFIADGQAWEGFEYDDPPVQAGIAWGPFVESDAAEVVIDRMRQPGADAARRGAPVTSIHVRGPGPATDAGIAVGSTLAMLRRAYGDFSLRPVPPTFGDDECVATSPWMAGVYFVFSSSQAAVAGGRIIRIDVRRH